MSPIDQGPELPSEAATLAHAFLRAGDALGLTRAELKAVLGQSLHVTERNGLDPASPAGARALLLIRVYQSLFALVGGAAGDMVHWTHTANRALGGVPAEKLKSPSGLRCVVEYLESMSR